jgi:hypothetical protein
MVNSMEMTRAVGAEGLAAGLPAEVGVTSSSYFLFT